MYEEMSWTKLVYITKHLESKPEGFPFWLAATKRAIDFQSDTWIITSWHLYNPIQSEITQPVQSDCISVAYEGKS